MSLLLHCGGTPATFEDICSIDPPQATASYAPIAHGDIVRLLEQEVFDRWGLEPTGRAFGTAHDGARLFGTLKYQITEEKCPEQTYEAFTTNMPADILRENGYSIGFRNSYDKSMSVVVVDGLHVFVCDNLSIHGSHRKQMRKHTGDAWEDLVHMVVMMARSCAQHFRTTALWQQNMKARRLPLENGYQFLGLARGNGILTPTQFNESMREWQRINGDEPHAHQQYKETAYALFQSFTQGLKVGNPQRKLDEYTNASAFFERRGLASDIEDAIIV